MIQYLLKTSEEIRVDSEYDVEELQAFLKKDAEEQNYVISSFSYKQKPDKVNDDVYFICKVVKVFNSEKDPDMPLRKIMYTTFEPEVMAERDATVEFADFVDEA